MKLSDSTAIWSIFIALYRLGICAASPRDQCRWKWKGLHWRHIHHNGFLFPAPGRRGRNDSSKQSYIKYPLYFLLTRYNQEAFMSFFSLSPSTEPAAHVRLKASFHRELSVAEF